MKFLPSLICLIPFLARAADSSPVIHWSNLSTASPDFTDFPGHRPTGVEISELKLVISKCKADFRDVGKAEIEIDKLVTGKSARYLFFTAQNQTTLVVYSFNAQGEILTRFWYSDE